MHEMSICESIISLIEQQSVEQSFSKVSRVCLEVGPLAGVELESLRFSFDVVCRGVWQKARCWILLNYR